MGILKIESLNNREVIFLIVSNNNDKKSRRTHNVVNPKNRNSSNWERVREVQCNHENEQKGRVGEDVEIQLHPWCYGNGWLLKLSVKCDLDGKDFTDSTTFVWRMKDTATNSQILYHYYIIFYGEVYIIIIRLLFVIKKNQFS
jgi:hypothetical protein